MRLVYPPNNHQTFESGTFLMGAAAPSATVTLNQQPVTISAQGFFTITVPLAPGENRLILSETTHAGEVNHLEVSLFRLTAPAVEALPGSLEMLQPYASPQTPTGLKPGDVLPLRCPAPVGAQVVCRIHPLASEPIHLKPSLHPPDNRDGVFSQMHQVERPWPDAVWHVGSFTVPVDALPQALSVIYELRHGDTRYTLAPLGPVEILPAQKHYGRITVEEAITRYAPIKGARGTPLRHHTVLELGGYSHDHVEVIRGNGVSPLWVSRQDVEPLESVGVNLPIPLHYIHTRQTEYGFELQLPLTHLPPIDYSLEEHRVRVHLYGVTSRCDFIQYAPGIFSQGLAHIAWQQPQPEVVTIDIALDSALFGFDYAYHLDAQVLTLQVKTAKAMMHKPFVIAIDAGHGGAETGSTAPDGTPEKDLNLQLALLLKNALAGEPALRVVLIRAEDETVSLPQRVNRAIEAGASMLISLHHNALPDGRDPWQERGVSTFYYHPFSLSLARHLQHALVHGTEFEDYGILYDSLYMCRVPQMPSVLLELGFFTHPEDAALCLNPQHQQKVIKALVHGLLAWQRHHHP